MTLEVFPDLDGLTFATRREPAFNTQVTEFLSGAESRFSVRNNPKTTFTLNYDFLLQEGDDQQLTTLLSFFYRHLGRAKAFLYDCPQDNYTQGAFQGTGTGARTEWQLRRPIVPKTNVAFESCNNIRATVNPEDSNDVTPYIYVDKVLQTMTTDYTISDTGVVTFVVAPADGAQIHATFYFFYRCRFANDLLPIDQVNDTVFEAQDLAFVGSPVNLV